VEFPGRPGSRVPHARIGPGLSTLDLCSDWYVLLVNGPGWADEAARAGVAGHDVGSATGLPAGGAMLVRPDAIVAWRADAPMPPRPVLEQLGQADGSMSSSASSAPGPAASNGRTSIRPRHPIARSVPARTKDTSDRRSPSP
jgi:hypothetical protein